MYPSTVDIFNAAGKIGGTTDPLVGTGFYLQDPNIVSYTVNGVNYNSAGEPIAPGTTPTSTTSGTSGTSDGTSTVNRNLLQQGLDTTLAGLQGQYDLLGPQEEQQRQLKVENPYNTTKGRLEVDYNTGLQNLGNAQNTVNTSKERSLGNLRTWLQGMGQGYNNQLGAMGAGNSSATGLINFALGQQGSRERGNILQDAGAQLNQIDAQGKQMQVEYNRNLQDLELWKETSLQDITSRYTQARQQIQTAMGDARAKAYAEMELTQQAIAELQNIQNQYSNFATELQNQLASFAGPTQQLQQNMLSYNARPVQGPNLSGIKMPTPVNPEQGLTALYRKRDDDLLANPMGV